MDWIEVNGAALRYDVQGAGPATVVLIHEMGGTLESWDAVVPKLASKRRVLRYDTRGAGLSEKIRGTADIDVMADDLAALLDGLKITGRVAVAGIAVGGAIAIHFAFRHAARTAALIPMSPAIGMAPERRAATLAVIDAMEAMGTRAGIDAGLVPSYPEALRSDVAAFHGIVLKHGMSSGKASYEAHDGRQPGTGCRGKGVIDVSASGHEFRLASRSTGAAIDREFEVEN